MLYELILINEIEQRAKIIFWVKGPAHSESEHCGIYCQAFSEWEQVIHSVTVMYTTVYFSFTALPC